MQTRFVSITAIPSSVMPMPNARSSSARASSRSVAADEGRRGQGTAAEDGNPHTIELGKAQTDLYETIRAAMDKRVREAIAVNGLDKSQIVVLDALLKLRQVCCHPRC
jgi:hypothetical protein